MRASDDFDTIFEFKPDYAFDHKHVESILRHRKELGNTLFFDRIGTNIGLSDPQKSYPPRSNPDLRSLWQKVLSCTKPEHLKHALLYYILKDCRQLSGVEAHFARKVYLPEKYQLFMCGTWELDHCQFSRALEHLTDPSLTPTFTDEILYTLISHPKCDNGLAMAYYITVSPPLQDQRTLDAYFSLLCQTSVMEAYYFCRRQDEIRHQSMFETLIIAVHAEAAGESRATRALTLIGLPFSDQEESWFEDCLLRGQGASCQNAKDSVMTRRIAMGKDIDGIGALDRLRGHKINGVNWDDVRINLQKAGPS